MIPFLVYPLALLGLVALPLLTAIYIFRSRFRPRPVSSLILWRFLNQPRLGGARRERLQLPWVFFLELFVILLLVVAAAGPHPKLARHQRPLVVVLDDSVSMRAEVGGTTAHARARAFLEDLVRQKRPPLMRFVLAGTRPLVLESQVHVIDELGRALQQWRCLAPMAGLDRALAVASELGRGQAELLVLTDHAPPEGLPRTERLVWVAFGQPTANAGIVNASRTPYADQDRCMLEVFNGSSSNLTTTLAVRAGTNLLITERVSLEPRASRRFVFTVPGTTPALHAELVPDALAEDNHVQLLPSLRKRVRVRVAVTNPELAGLIERTLDATGLRAPSGAAPELVIYEGTGTVRGEDLWTLRIVRGDSPALYTGPFLIDAAHPLGRGLALLGTVWAATALSSRPGEVPVIMAGNVPLLTVFRGARGNQHATLNFDHAHSTVQSSAAWPCCARWHWPWSCSG